MATFMRIMTQIGEASALLDGKEYLIRPTFSALASLGDVDEIDTHIRQVCLAYDLYLSGRQTPSLGMLSCCANVLEACSDFPPEWLGECVESRSGWRWRQGRITVHELIIMAHHCIKWGVSGDSKFRDTAKRRKKQDKPELFDPHSFVAVMIDEFHMSREDAWQSTMTEFQRLVEQRQRKNWGGKPPPPTQEEAANTMKMAHDAIRRARELGLKPTIMGRRK